MRCRSCRRACEILCIGNVRQPFNVLAVERFLHGNVRHRSCGGRAVPVLVAGRAPDDISRTNLDDRLAFALGPPAARCDDQCLAQWMGMSS